MRLLSNGCIAASLLLHGLVGAANAQPLPRSTGTAPIDVAWPLDEIPAPAAPGRLGVEGRFPKMTGGIEWINSPPLTPEGLRGKVVLVNVWTYSCINSLRPLPFVRAWAAKYRNAGLVTIGVHSPEFAFEKVPANVRRAVSDMHIAFPVVLDSDLAIWHAFENQYWPAFYFIDARGRIRHHRFGEERYEQSEHVLQQLLAEAGATDIPTGFVTVTGVGIEAPPSAVPARSEETYLGYGRANSFVSPDRAAPDRARTYRGSAPAKIDDWSLAGTWRIERERVVLAEPGGRITYRFHARDLHLVLGAAEAGKPVRFRVSVDGKPPLSDHGGDTDAQGNGAIDGHRLYQLVRQTQNRQDHLFEIEFLDAGAQAYVFTFG